MKAPRFVFNPFIVLSDVTIATLVVMCCILMLFSASIMSSAKLERRKEDLARRIGEQQNQLFQEAERVKERWDKKLAILQARGLQSCLFRIYGESLFSAEDDGRALSKVGKEALEMFARNLGPVLAQQMGSEAGAVIEIQVRGHCARQFKVDPWRLSMDRAMSATAVLARADRFPSFLLSVAGLSHYRPVYLPSKRALYLQRQKHSDYSNFNDEAFVRISRDLRWEKPVLADRIDIVIMYAGDGADNSFVAAREPVTHTSYGPSNDASDPYLFPPALGFPYPSPSPSTVPLASPTTPPAGAP